MPIHTNSIDEFRKLYQEECGKYLSEEDAIEMVARLIGLYQILYRPLPGEHNDVTTPPLADSCDEYDASFPNPE